MAVKTIELDCETFDFFKEKTGVTVDHQEEIDHNTMLYEVTTKQGVKKFITETASLYGIDGFVTTLKIYDSKEEIKD